MTNSGSQLRTYVMAVPPGSILISFVPSVRSEIRPSLPVDVFLSGLKIGISITRNGRASRKIKPLAHATEIGRRVT
jgi:hypothetical protein